MQVTSAYPEWTGTNYQLSQITYNSQAVIPGALFVAIRGEKTDGHKYLQDAKNRGAVLAVVETIDETIDIPQIVVANTQIELARVSSLFYGTNNHAMKYVGITGTDGKTSTATIIEYLLADQVNVGYIGTNGVRFGGHSEPHTLTTPLAPELHRIFHDMQNADVDIVAMEVSSHALSLHRVDSINFDVAVFTNLTHDHLDFHGTFENYLAAKRLLFENLAADTYAVVNNDDQYVQAFSGATKAQVVSYGQRMESVFRAANIRFDQYGTSFTLYFAAHSYHVQTKLLATFNVYNILAALATGYCLGLSLEKMIARIEMMPAVEGRMELINEGQDFAVIIDFAHAPAALQNVLEFARSITSGKLYVVVGAAGARDTAKRPVMGAIATDIADVAIFTTDDPYFEDPNQIIDEMVAGLTGDNYIRIVDRAEAIAYALEIATTGDAVVIAGRGNYDILPINGEDIHFNDIDFTRECLNK